MILQLPPQHSEYESNADAFNHGDKCEIGEPNAANSVIFVAC